MHETLFNGGAGEMVGFLVAVVLYLKMLGSVSYDLDLEKSTLSVGLDPAVILPDVVRSGVLVGRAAADISYDAIIYDKRSGVLSINGLNIVRPEAAVAIERVSISSILDKGSEIDLRIAVQGVTVGLDSLKKLPRPVKQALKSRGLDPLRASAVAEIAYDFRTSALLYRVSLEADGLGRFYGRQTARGLYLDSVGRYRPRLRGKLTSTVVGFENRGLVELALNTAGMSPMSEERAQGMAKQLSEKVKGWFVGVDRNPEAETGSAPPLVTAFTDALEKAARELLTKREGVALVIEPTTPIEIAGLDKFKRLERRPSQRVELLALLQPKLGARPMSKTAVIPDLSPAALDALEGAERLRVIKAMISGVGAPRSLGRAIGLLKGPKSTPSESLLLAQALVARGGAGDMVAAYRAARFAAAHRVKGAAALAAKIASELSAAEMLAAERRSDVVDDAAEKLISAANAGDPAAMRRLAEAYEAGQGVTRSLALAYRWALLASAAGDRAANRMRARLEHSFAGGTAADKKAWAAAKATEAGAASTIWSSGLGAKAAAQ
ncbi:MAG: hypothetical protein MRY74_12110 [Neomegalonema sp.]|nr:hypothetical protein [Neomegalonema sp.]